MGNILSIKHPLNLIMSAMVRYVPIIIVVLLQNFIMKTLKKFVYPLEHLCVPQGARIPHLRN